MTLSAYMTRMRDVPFGYGRNDCLSFVSGALRAQGLSTLPTEWSEGYSDIKGAIRRERELVGKSRHRNIIEAMDDMYQRVFTLFPTDGSIVARRESGPLGYAFGVVYRGGCAFVSERGIIEDQVRPGDMFWTVR